MAASLALAVVIVVTASAAGTGTSPGAVYAATTPAKPNHFDPASQSTSVKPVPPARSTAPPAPPPLPTPTHVLGTTMAPATLALSPTQATRFTSGDGLLEVDAPAAPGNLSLAIRQLLPPSGSNAGGSGHYSFGTYLAQLVDASGHPVQQKLSQPLAVRLHPGKRGGAVDLAHTLVTVNGSPPVSAAGAGRTTSASGASGPRSIQRATLDTASGTLSANVPLSGSSSFSFNTDSPVATFGKPDPFNVSLSGGSLAADYPLDLPSGPGGLTPPVTLAYSSAGTSEQHNPQGAAPWVGEGWNLGLGEISWAEHNVRSGCPSCGVQWEDSWALDDPFGTSAELVPPNIDVTTYYDDTPNNITASPLTWHTAPETHAKVISYVGPNSLPGMTAVPPCFRVFLPDGITEEFGCTPDSLQFYPNPSGSFAGLDYIVSWKLDLITDPQGNQVHVTYQSDTETGINSISYPRDTELATIEYDSPGCHNAQAACTGSFWAPLMRVSFSASHSVAHVLGSSCAANGSLRCDAPVDLSGSGGLAAPIVQSTFVLNDALVQVRASGTASWSTLRDYQLSYDQAAPGTIPDPVSGASESVAGKLDLTRISEIGSDGSTALPARVFGYTPLTQYYEDSLQLPSSPTNCGPSWNNGITPNGHTGCILWSQSYAGNSMYVSTASNGLGLSDAFTWQLARNNFHGVNGGGTANVENPFFCNGTSVQSTYPCNMPDDGTWSRAVLTQQMESVVRLTQNGQGGGQTSTPVNSTTSYAYQVTDPLPAQECADCQASFYWGSQNDNDYLDYYNAKFMGFAQTTVSHPDGAVDVHKFYSTEGFGVYDTTQLPCDTDPPNPCHNAPWWDLANVAHGHEFELDRYATDGTTLLGQVKTTWQATCPPSGVSGSPAVSGDGDWKGNLVSELDHSDPVAVCDVQQAQVDTYTYDGSTSSSVPHQSVAYAYDAYGRVTSQTTTSNDGGANGSPTTIVAKTSYSFDDNVNATGTSATGTYLIDFPGFSDVEDSSGDRFSCTYTSYDGQANTLGQTSGLTLGETTRVDRYTNCGTSGNGFTPSGPITTTHTYDTYGNLLTTTDPDANAGNTAHVGCTVGSTQYSTCATFDSTFAALPTAATNALGQTAHTGYQAPGSATALGGFGLWPISTTDVNGQTTSMTYDALGRATSTTLPGEGGGLTTTAAAYTVWCSGTAAQTPCVEVDSTQRLNSTTTVTARSFYDGLGHLVETRTPAPGGQDVVRYSLYDAAERQVFQSVPYLVAAYTGGAGSAAFSIPDSTQAGTTYAYDGLGRQTSTTDALSDHGTSAYSVVCGAAGTGDNACNEQTLTVDGNGHQGGTLADALGRTQYVQRYTGNSSSTYALYATAKYTYDFVGELTQILQPDGSTKTTYQYDMAGRKTATTDADLGSQTYTYDQDGNLTESVDARGASGTVFTGYDGLDRPIWKNTTNSPTGAFGTYAFDSTAGGNVGVGRLTSETFAEAPGNGLTGTYAYVYDARGRQTSSTLTVGSATFPLQSVYDDAGNVTSQTYPDGELVTNGYTAQGWLSQVTTSLNSTTLLSGAAYTGAGGGFGELTGASLGGGTYTYSATYDLLDRATDLKTTVTSGGATMLEQSRTFDAAGNVATTNTTLPAGTDHQAFCYDEQDRLTWAGSTGTPPCTGQAISAGTLTSAQYSQSFSYDVLGRLISGPLGTYTYGDPAHVHAATAIGAQYTARYDVAGDMTCRAPSSSTTCSGTQTAAQLGYDSQGQLTTWQNTPSSPTATAAFLTDGQGQRVAQQVTQGGTTTTTVYVGAVEEVSTSGSTTTTTAYYYAGGKRIALSVNGTISYLAEDALGSASVALSTSGSATASVLYAPYGAQRYSSGTMPGTYGFTGQRADALSGLDYYGARYYDSLAGQFTSADTVVPGDGYDLWGLSRYAYVQGNPENRTDPSGHISLMIGADGAPAPIENAFSGTYAWGVAPVRHHPGIRAPYRPPSRSSPPPAPRAPRQEPPPPPPPTGNEDHPTLVPTTPSRKLGVTGIGGRFNIVWAEQSGEDGGDSGGSGSGGGGGAAAGAGLGAAALARFLQAVANAGRAELEGGQVLQDAANAIRESLAGDPAAVLGQLSRAEGDAAQSAPYLWRIFFCRAVERAMARLPEVREVFDYTGAGRGADFVLRATQSEWEVTADAASTVARHLARPYVEAARLIKYVKLP
jgi:RHS repeat-associated protein